MSISNASVHEPSQGPLRPQGGRHGPAHHSMVEVDGLLGWFAFLLHLFTGRHTCHGASEDKVQSQVASMPDHPPAEPSRWQHTDYSNERNYSGRAWL